MEDKKIIGIVDCNPLSNQNRNFVMERIRDLIPSTCEIKNFHYTETYEFMNCDALVLSGSELFAADYQRMIEEDSLEGEDYLHVNRLEKALEAFYEPVFGICFGGQLLAHVCGAKLGKMPALEIGYLDHLLTADGHADQIFSTLPDRFYAAHSHYEIVEELPASQSVQDARVLATRDGRIHAYKIITSDGRLRYGVQPHPEFSNTESATYFLISDEIGLRSELGDTQYERLLEIPTDANFEFGNIVTRFIESEVCAVERV
jgi:GMP synthase-like glutamine amidotransferase